MGYKNREIETKFIVTSYSSYREIEDSLNTLLNDDRATKISGASKDVYWKPPRGSEADFVRVRYLPEDDSGQLTLKHTDKDNTQDRVEIDVDVANPDQAVELYKRLLGDPAGIISKRYTVYFLDKRDTTVSLYKIQSDPRFFIEVEARTKEKMDKVISRLKEDIGLSLEVVNKSLFDIFIKGR